jgi:hypothetical protein
LWPPADIIIVAPDEPELEELVPAMPGDVEPPEPDAAGVPPEPDAAGVLPEPAPPPPLTLTPVAPPPLGAFVPPAAEETDPLVPRLSGGALPAASEELPHPATKPTSPQTVAMAVRGYMYIS